MLSVLLGKVRSWFRMSQTDDIARRRQCCLRLLCLFERLESQLVVVGLATKVVAKNGCSRVAYQARHSLSRSEEALTLTHDTSWRWTTLSAKGYVSEQAKGYCEAVALHLLHLLHLLLHQHRRRLRVWCSSSCVAKRSQMPTSQASHLRRTLRAPESHLSFPLFLAPRFAQPTPTQ